MFRHVKTHLQDEHKAVYGNVLCILLKIIENNSYVMLGCVYYCFIYYGN
jgi:hypothetical protein